MTNKVSIARLITLAAATLAAAPAAGASTNQLVTLAAVTTDSAAWVSSDGTLLAHGSGSAWHVVRHATGEAWSGFVADEIRGGVLAGRRLYVDRPGGLSVIEFGAGNTQERPLVIGLEPGGDRLVTRALDYLLVWEQGVGLHSVSLPPPPPPAGHAPAGGSRHGERPMTAMPAGFLPVATRATALAASGTTVYAALADGTIARYKLDDRGAPHAATPIANVGPARALALNGSRLYVLGESGLRVFDAAAASGTGSPAIVYPGVTGNALAVSGRLVVIGSDDGVTTSREPSAAAATHVVTLTNFEFTPSSLTIDVGDTVQWNNGQGFHDVNSCNVGETGCSSNATESFSSGAARSAPWTFSYTFTLPGPNPYTCTVHAGIGMTGTVTVNPASVTPPAIPDGDAGTVPLTVRKTSPAGSTLEVSFDDTSCAGIAGSQILGGAASDLPSAPGGAYGITVSRCSCGTASPCIWSDSPLPEPGQMIWFVMVARDAATTEGSWGTDSAGSERRGPGAGGSSGQCGSTGKNVTNRCGI